jgi:hypothetical protein
MLCTAPSRYDDVQLSHVSWMTTTILALAPPH